MAPEGNSEEVRVHDFLIKELGRAVPYGVYDLAADKGWINVGIDHDTAAFAVATIRRWGGGRPHPISHSEPPHHRRRRWFQWFARAPLEIRATAPLPFPFPAVGRKKITAAFDGGRITSILA